MTEFDHFRAGSEAVRSQPDRPWRPGEELRQDLLFRYLSAVASAAESRPGTAEQPSSEEAPSRPQAEPTEHALRVRDAMQVPAAAVLGSTPFLDLVRAFAREHLSAVAVIDAEERVVGVVSESDLLAKAAIEAGTPKAGPISRLRQHGLYEKSRGETAATLMTAPAITVHPGTPVTQAAWLAARSRLKRLPVTDHHGRLVGTVSRMDLLTALVRDDDRIREEIRCDILERALNIDPGSVQIEVDHGLVTLKGHLDSDRSTKLLEQVWAIEDVVGVVDDLDDV
ncbi:hypothetical protein TR51_16980 [Kitasatospora griseola]|uniref:CBS domain-containing protein n=1 Tax=Kitasatospora griseola TaxID=2064 RepID=A0A0D0PSN1_KITGR|nr:CBS domain-containing protein [Kitasatospora griseola]KIQ65544.1 hypothetical protein TR51_16980 [Kitasatospora griseola]